MFGSRKREKDRRDAKVRQIAGMPDDKVVVLAFHAGDWETGMIAQAAIVSRWMKEHGYTMDGTKKTEDQ